MASLSIPAGLAPLRIQQAQEQCSEHADNDHYVKTVKTNPIGPGIVASYIAGAYVLNLRLGASVTNPPQLPSMAIFLGLLLLGGMMGEPGWSGYASRQVVSQDLYSFLTSREVVAFLKQLQRLILDLLLVIWDGSSTHRSLVIKDYLARECSNQQSRRLASGKPSA